MTDLQIIRPAWAAPAGVHAAVSTRVGGISAEPYVALNLATHVGDDAAAVAVNRQRLAAALALPSAPVWLEQVHGTQVVELSDRAGPGRAADAAFTRQPGVVCAVLTADCLPILLCNTAGTVVAAIHAGWRGLLAGVVGACVAEVRCASGAADEWLAWLGPCIGPTCFEVGPEVRAAFVARDADYAPAFEPAADDRYRADLPELARHELRRCGVDRVHSSGLCTFSEPDRFYSYRRDGRTGRMATLIWR